MFLQFMFLNKLDFFVFVDCLIHRKLFFNIQTYNEQEAREKHSHTPSKDMGSEASADYTPPSSPSAPPSEYSHVNLLDLIADAILAKDLDAAEAAIRIEDRLKVKDDRQQNLLIF